MCLEGELNETLLFEHGGCQPTSPLWISRILLGHLFRERVALGRTVKVFAKHYRKEVMRGLVKIQDLVDLAEPPLGSLSAIMSTRQRCSEDMELDVKKRSQSRIRRTPWTTPTRPISDWAK